MKKSSKGEWGETQILNMQFWVYSTQNIYWCNYSENFTYFVTKDCINLHCNTPKIYAFSVTVTLLHTQLVISSVSTLFCFLFLSLTLPPSQKGLWHEMPLLACIVFLFPTFLISLICWDCARSSKRKTRRARPRLKKLKLHTVWERRREGERERD